MAKAKQCPCPAECERHGDCSACREYHRGRGQLTACERLESRDAGRSVQRASSGKQFRLMNFASCAG